MKLSKLCTLLFLCCVSYAQAQKNVKKYYFPLGKTTTTKVYRYVDKNDTTHVEYWKVITNQKTNTIKTISYDKNFRIYNVFEEVLTEKGAQLTGYTDYDELENGKHVAVSATIQKVDVYLWESTKTFAYSFSYTNQYGFYKYTKNRKFDDIEKITVHGKEYEVAVFQDAYHVYNKDQNKRYMYPQRTYYATNIGVVQYKRKLPWEKRPIILQLTQILTEAEFEALQR